MSALGTTPRSLSSRGPGPTPELPPIAVPRQQAPWWAREDLGRGLGGPDPPGVASEPRRAGERDIWDGAESLGMGISGEGGQ